VESIIETFPEGVIQESNWGFHRADHHHVFFPFSMLNVCHPFMNVII
jgi:hypothetical protein